MATVSNRGGGRCPCGPAEGPGRQMSLDCQELSGQCVTEQSAVSCGARRCSAPSSEAERSSPSRRTPIPSCFNGMGMSEFHLLMFSITSVLVSLPISCNPQHFKTHQPADRGSLLLCFWPRLRSQPVLSWRLCTHPPCGTCALSSLSF